MSKLFAFDRPMQSELRQALTQHLRRVIPHWQSTLGLRTALDIGCGVGYYSAMLCDLGFQVVAADARATNIVEARSRHPGIDFRVAEAEDSELSSLGAFDLVLCLGLLYHLENPVQVVRSLRALTSKLLLIESKAVPVEKPFFIIADEPAGEDQSLEAVSCYPSEGAIVKMCYRAGFPNVYRFRELPDHENYVAAIDRKPTRTMIAASLLPLNSPLIEVAPEPSLSRDGRTTDPNEVAKMPRRLRRH